MSAKNTPDSFWARVRKGTPDECWEWQGAKATGGYGQVGWHGANVFTHRVAYFLHYGGIELNTGCLIKGVAKVYKEFVLHKCDNPACCNPSHLFLGSAFDNARDAVTKGRWIRPQSKHVNAKLTADQVRDIRRLYAEGSIVQTALAKKFGVCQAVISSIVRLEAYKDIT
jgi:hypothetical protein